MDPANTPQCGMDAAHCDPSTCLPNYSGTNSTCPVSCPPSPSSASHPHHQLQIPTTTSSLPPAPIKTPSSTTTLPDIDTCGPTSDISCPGAGPGAYYYRCCSAYGHCGPKNNLQDQNLYCGDGCQPGFGKCDNEAAPPDPTTAPGIAPEGEPCGPIVNMRCAEGLCCSGSNYCGTGVDFCGAANWCQARWGVCA
jgi:hypothetical protein